MLLFLVAVHTLGFAGTCIARATHESRYQQIGQRLFFGCLAVVGCGAMITLARCPLCGLVSSLALAVMAVGGVADFDTRNRPKVI